MTRVYLMRRKHLSNRIEQVGDFPDRDSAELVRGMLSMDNRTSMNEYWIDPPAPDDNDKAREGMAL